MGGNWCSGARLIGRTYAPGTGGAVSNPQGPPIWRRLSRDAAATRSSCGRTGEFGAIHSASSCAAAVPHGLRTRTAVFHVWHLQPPHSAVRPIVPSAVVCGERRHADAAVILVTQLSTAGAPRPLTD